LIYNTIRNLLMIESILYPLTIAYEAGIGLGDMKIS